MQDSLAGFYPHLERCLAEHLLYRLGLKADTSEAESFSEQLFKAAASSQIAFDRLFYDLYGGTINAEHASTLWQTHQPLAELAARAGQFERRQSDRQIQTMRALPYFTLEIEQVEAIWAPIAASDDWQLFEDALSHIRAYGRALAGDDN